jgi:archaellum component FlaC
MASSFTKGVNMTDMEMKALGVRLSVLTIDRFAERAKKEGLSQTEMLEKIMAQYLDELPPKDLDSAPKESGLDEAIERIHRAASDIEKAAMKVKESEGVEGYKKTIRDVADEVSSLSRLIGSVKTLHGVLSSAQKTIMDAAEGASEPFAKLVLDQAQQAEKFKASYEQMATNIQTLDALSKSAVKNAEKVANCLDSDVKGAVAEVTTRVFEKADGFLDKRNTFLQALMLVALLGTAGSFAAIWMVWKVIPDQTISCRIVTDNLYEAACAFQARNSGPLTDLAKRVRCEK